MTSLTYTVVLERSEDGGYTVTVPALKGCVTPGNTIAEALSRVKEAVECHVEALTLLGKRIPPDCKVVRLDAEDLSEVLICADRPVRHPMPTGRHHAAGQ